MNKIQLNVIIRTEIVLIERIKKKKCSPLTLNELSLFYKKGLLNIHNN